VTLGYWFIRIWRRRVEMRRPTPGSGSSDRAQIFL